MYNILAGQKEAERVLYKDDHPEDGFLLLPDLKWDQTSMNAMVSTSTFDARALPLGSGRLESFGRDVWPILADE